MNVCMLKAGERARILRVRAEGAVGTRLRALGLLPQREILLVCTRGKGKTLLLQADALIAMDREVAACIQIQPIPSAF